MNCTFHMNKMRNFWVFALAAFILIGCGSSAQQETVEDEAPAEDIVLEDEVTTLDIAKEDFERMLDEIPDPTVVPVLLEKTGSEFNSSFLNPASKANDYKTTSSKAALNLGVLSADLGYLCAYSKAQEAINYLNATQNLVEHLGASSAMQTSLLKRFEANLSNTDSLIAIVDQSIDLAKDYLYEGEQFSLSAMVAAGSYIEGLYISTSLVQNYPKDLPEAQRQELLKGLIKTILEQKDPLGKLVNVLKEVKDDGELFVSIRDDIRTLFNTYDLLSIEQKLESGKEDELLSDETLLEIANQVDAIRTKIID